LKIETTPRDDHQVNLVVEFDAETMEEFRQRAARKIAREAKIPGFRPGKAPYAIIRRTYGDEAIEEQAIDLLVENKYPVMLDEAKIEPGAPGSMEKIISKDPLKVSFIIPLEPTVTLGDYHSIRQEYKLEPVGDEKIDAFLRRMQTAYSTSEPVERPAQKGDMVYAKISAKRMKPKEGEPEELLTDTPYQGIIGDDPLNDNDFPFEGFSEHLNGLSSGSVESIRYSYPKDSKYEKLQGEKVEFVVTVETVKSVKLPELDDNFAQMMGAFENLDALRKTVREQFENEAKDNYESVYFNDLLKKIIEKSTIKYPPQVLDHEMEHVLEDITADLAQQKLDLDTYLKSINKDKAAFLEEQVKPTAKERIERTLILQELSKAEGIKLEESEMSQEFSKVISELQANNELKNLRRKLSQQELVNSIAMQTANRLMNNHIMERIKLIATGEYKAEAKDTEEKTAKKKATKAVQEEPVESSVAKPTAKKAAKTAKPETAEATVEKPAKKKTTKTVKDGDVNEKPTE